MLHAMLVLSTQISSVFDAGTHYTSFFQCSSRCTPHDIPNVPAGITDNFIVHFCSTRIDHRSYNIVNARDSGIIMTPYMAEPVESVTVYEGSIEFEEAANAMADKCLLYSYQGVFYNMPTWCDLKPPFYCVTQGRYIGVFPSFIWNAVKTELWTPGNYIANYVTVQSLVVGEQKVHRAIRYTACAIGSSASSVQTIICTKATLKRKKKPKLNFYCSVLSSSRQHTQYQVHQDGSISYTLQRLKPPKNAKPTINNQSRAALTLHDAPFSIPEPFDDLPLDVSLDFLGQQRRKQAAGSSFVDVVKVPRIIPSRNNPSGRQMQQSRCSVLLGM
ncbi:uncharacterized protein EDB91DRAFT_1088700 [Suillus paluster]|uniref:uncharacterized protein n=1 Tax=Suillus paluster TaxID=48578 RepID=UPI001B860859|nr:uncharacterized protein EDB91DRAFT_1088700 [Suillus paluster]KAG1720794.1 hypothetical protein EDB91DRAFT_1088700 [Suillus paluster]